MPRQTRATHPLKAYRKAHRLTQAAAAQQVGISQAHWCDIEGRRRWAHPKLARKISDLTGVSLELLLNFGDNEKQAQRRRRTSDAA